MRTLPYVLAVAGIVAAQVPAHGQCGGSGFRGETACTSGFSCVIVNSHYSHCQAENVTTLSHPAPSKSSLTSLVATAPTTTAAGPLEESGTPRFLGRVNPVTRELTWPGTGVAFTFTGTQATIGLSSTKGTNSADLVIDGGMPIIISNVVGTSVTTSILPQGLHTVEFRKRSEASFGSIFLGNITTDGTLHSTVVSSRQIEIIGDSITVGYGLDGTYPCTNTAALEDNPKTYAALAASSLMADYNVIAWSGKGITRNYASSTPDTSPLLPELWTRYGANDADDSYTFPSSWSPQAVVINLGTNDFSYLGVRTPLNSTVYTKALVSFGATIRSHYPNAQLFFLSSPMLSNSYPTAADAQHDTQVTALKAVVSKLGTYAHFVDWPSQGNVVGCDYHPDAATHAAEASVLRSVMSVVLSW